VSAARADGDHGDEPVGPAAEPRHDDPATVRPRDVRLRWHRTSLDGRTAFYGDAGEGPPVVFVHGWGLSARSYAKALPTIAAQGHRVIAPALPGFGRSDGLPGAYTFERLANWLDEVLEHVGIEEPVALVGHSFGGGVATATAWHHPDRVRSLTLVNSIGGSVWKDGRRGPRSLADRPLWDWGLHLPAEFRRKTARKALPVVLRDAVGNAVTNPGAVWRAATLARTADQRGELAELAERGLPVAILWGSEDTVVPEATFLAMCDAAGATGDIIEDAGHSWLIVDPEGFGELVTNSLAVRDQLTTRTPGPTRTADSLDRPA
jgi:pimeloyl-ACP methyl ester carboxylesterase